MINKHNELLTRIRTAVQAEYPKASVSAEYVNEPSNFPHISVEVLDMAPAYMDNMSNEQYTRITLEVGIFTNKRSGALEEAFKIADLVSEAMLACNMNRTVLHSLRNLANNSIKRLVLRFEGTADENYFYRR